MCGIVAVLARPSSRPLPSTARALDALAGATSAVAGIDLRMGAHPDVVRRLAAVATVLEDADRSLRGAVGVAAILADGAERGPGALAAAAAGLAAAVAGLEGALDGDDATVDPVDAEMVNAALLRIKDAGWALGHDRVATARGVADLSRAGVRPLDAGPHDARPLDARPLGAAEVGGWWAIQVALSSIDRLEVRGRDSAGLHVLLSGHGLEPGSAEVAELLAGRAADPLFTSMAVRTPPGCLSLVYKAAAEIGELGDNVAALRRALRSDPLLALALAQPSTRTTVVGHTRWASVGTISEANAHPLNSDEGGPVGPYVVAALNGDVDNHLELRAAEELVVAAEVTTDAKIIPALVSHRVADSGDRGDPATVVAEAFRSTVRRFEGSVAIVASAAATPDQLHLALRGSGQSLNVGLADDAFVVASEAYGLVEETARYIRLDGEVTRGQTVILDRAGAGTLEGIDAATYGGDHLPLGEADVATAEVTTRDIDRAGFPHFLLKEISEAPRSFRRTLRGRVTVGADGRLAARLGDEALPPAVVADLASGRVARILVIGQGTAAVAGQAVAAALGRVLPQVPATALPATELSGFGLIDDMSDTLVVAVSQSGTTTDTNRTVDLVRARGASVLAVVNRRNSDLAAKADGVLYTSDGRDVEMSVASTKAFYAQVAAGWLLALGLAAASGNADAAQADRALRSLRRLPDAMERVLERRADVARVAAMVFPPRRYWAVVGSGPDRIAAAEIRIKLSELCYKAIACDATEDKKHIDLSSEPLVVICAGGLSGPNADDVAKEVGIYRAHKAAPLVIAPAGEAARYRAALEVIEVPLVDPELAFVLSAMVGHLLGYEAALAIDAQAHPLREARAAIEEVAAGAGGPGLLDELAPRLRAVTGPFLTGLRSGAYNGHLEASTAVRLVSLLRYAAGELPVEGYEIESGKVGAPSALVTDLFAALSAGIDELTRPVDAIKHQAKTVTVGISRREDHLLTGALVRASVAAGAGPDTLGYRALRTLAALDRAVEEVTGFTRYRIDADTDGPTISVVDRGGVATALPSRTDTDHRLRGTKHRAADEREVTVARGRRDGRTVILVPEVKGTHVVGMTLLHVRFTPRLDAATAREVLGGYRGRYSALSDAVTETEAGFDDTVLAEVPLVDLLTEPVYVLADRWRRR